MQQWNTCNCQNIRMCYFVFLCSPNAHCERLIEEHALKIVLEVKLSEFSLIYVK